MEKLDIKPYDQRYAGYKIKYESWNSHYITVLFVGSKLIFAKDHNLNEVIVPIAGGWFFYLDSKQKKFMAPALITVPRPPVWDSKQQIHHVYPGFAISNQVYSSYEEAKQFLGLSFLSWPAIPNKDGFYEVPND